MEKTPKNPLGAGRKRLVTPEVMDKIYAILTVGASLKDAAEFLEIGATTIRKAKRDNPEFGRGVRKAIKNGKIRLIQKVGNAANWQAAAWMLERKWGKEYGRKDKIEHGGKIKTDNHTTIDFSSLTDDELLKFERAAAGRANRIGEPSAN